MKATDFNLAKDLKFDIAEGNVTFKQNRLVIFDFNSIGLLRQQVIETIGIEKARVLFLKFGYQNGYSDFLQMKNSYQFDTEMDLLASGPVIHTWEGIVHAAPKEISFDRLTGQFYFSGTWTNSYEAQQHLMYNDISKEPVCWSLMGYASGWCTAFFGKKLIAVEPVCLGKGDDVCEWLIKPEGEWGTEANFIINALKDF